MFGYRLIKNVAIDHLKDDLAHANVVIADQTKHIAELLDKIKERDVIIANLTELTKVKEEIVEEKPVKKVRRKSSKKTTKKEE
jgi:23S rRNA C2498 (ribose-2'-O)-methylase RlmM